MADEKKPTPEEVAAQIAPARLDAAPGKKKPRKSERTASKKRWGPKGRTNG